MALVSQTASAQRVFNVRDYGATGRKSDDARPALQKAIDACGKAGGGEVYVPPGEYTSGQLHLRSGVRLYVEAGATIYATLDGSQYDDPKRAALIYGEDLHDIALEGAGTLDGQAAYEWRFEQLHRLLHPAQPAPDGSDREAFAAVVSRGLWQGKRISTHGAACCAAWMCALQA